MTGIRKRSNDPKADQSKFGQINPLYNTSALIKSVSDRLEKVLGGSSKKKGK